MHKADVVMLWAACCLAYFCFMRIGELTVPTDNGYNASCHLSWGDVMVDDLLRPSRLEVRIKTSKTDPFRQDISLLIGRVTSDLALPSLGHVSLHSSKEQGRRPPFQIWRWLAIDQTAPGDSCEGCSG